MKKSLDSGELDLRARDRVFCFRKKKKIREIYPAQVSARVHTHTPPATPLVGTSRCLSFCGGYDLTHLHVTTGRLL